MPQICSMVVRIFEPVQGVRARRWGSQQGLVDASVKGSISCQHPALLLHLIQGILSNLQSIKAHLHMNPKSSHEERHGSMFMKPTLPCSGISHTGVFTHLHAGLKGSVERTLHVLM